MVSEMDPQSRKALLDDIEKMRGLTPMNNHGLLSFNCFMHIFIIITRHAKEQHIKELRKTEERRRRAFKLRDWKEYKKIVQHEIDIERVKYNNIIDYTLNQLNMDMADKPVMDKAYRASLMKYSMKPAKAR